VDLERIIGWRRVDFQPMADRGERPVTDLGDNAADRQAGECDQS
jgi:hypothetical protein